MPASGGKPRGTLGQIAGWRADLYPENRGYILRNAPRAAAALDRLATIGRPAMLTRLRQACALE